MKKYFILLIFVIPQFGNLYHSNCQVNEKEKTLLFTPAKRYFQQLVAEENQETDELDKNISEFELAGYEKVVPVYRNKNTEILFGIESKVQSTIFPLFYDLPPPD